MENILTQKNFFTLENNDIELLFRKGASLQEEMRSIFKNNNLSSDQLKYLPKHDFERWLSLHNESITLTKKISKIVNAKTD